MTTTLKALGGGAQPASIDTSGKTAGGPALRVYGFDSAAAAQAAGYVCEGGPAMSVALITDAQINSGAYRLEGDPAALVVYTAPASVLVEGGLPVPVYSVNGWGSTPAPIPPQFDSAEIGTVNSSTVAVTFDQDVSASDYKAGVTIKVNGASATINSATRQTNHAIVYYVLSAAVVYGDTVTWEYSEASGNIVAEDDSAPLEDVTAQSVTNNVADTIGNGLRADAVAYWKMDEASGTRIDATGRGNSLLSINSAAGIAGKIGNAVEILSFPNRYLQAQTRTADITFGNTTYTQILWVKVKDIAATQEITYNDENVGGSWDSSFSYDAIANRMQFGAGFDSVAADSFGSISADVWYFCIGIYNAVQNTISISVNLSSFDSYILGYEPDAANGNFWIGYPGAFCDVDVDEVGFWKRILTPAEFTYLYNSGAGRTLYP